MRERIWRVIFLSDTRAGQIFDIVLLVLIGASVMTVTTEVGRMMRDVRMDSRECGQCGWKGHDPAANYCKHCGHTLRA